MANLDPFIAELQRRHLPLPVCEHKFCRSRKWRFDMAYPDKRIAIEIEGGVHSRGRHTRGLGFIKDMEKYNSAVALGWRIYRFTPSQIESDRNDALSWLVNFTDTFR